MVTMACVGQLDIRMGKVGKNSKCNNDLGIISILIFIFKCLKKNPKPIKKKNQNQTKKPLGVLSGWFAFCSSHSIASVDDFISTTDLYFNELYSLHLGAESVAVCRLCLNF